MRALKKRSAKGAFVLRIFAVLAVLAFSWVLMNRSIAPTVKTAAATQAKTLVSQCIYEHVSKELEKMSAGQKLVNISTDSTGKVTLVETDTAALNRIGNNAVMAVLDAVREMENINLKLPSGTLTGFPFLSGRGPKVSFSVMPVGTASSNVESSFVSAGINQTLHRLVLNISVSVKVFVPGFTGETDVPVNFPLAETVIVGVTPESFTDLVLAKNEMPFAP